MNGSSLVGYSLILLIGIVIGFLLANFFARSKYVNNDIAIAKAQAETAKANEAAAQLRALQATGQANLAEVKERIAQAEKAAAQARQEQAEIAAALSGAQAQRDAAYKRAEELAADRKSLEDRFQVLSAEALERQHKQSDQVAEVRFKQTEQLMVPVSESLNKLEKRLIEVEKQRIEQSTQLQEQVKIVQNTSEVLRQETSTLSKALRNPQVRGAWGEQQLRRVVEISGMQERCDFDLQANHHTTEGNLRPDMVVHLADGKVIFVDSKVPLDALIDAYGTDDPTSQQEHLRRFVRHVRTHIDQLSAKNYFSLNIGSPEFVVLYLGSDEFYRMALQQDPTLHEYASKRQVVLSSPGILIPLLQTISHSWRQSLLAENAAQVQKLGLEIHDRLTKMGDHFTKVGNSLTTAVNAYNSTVGTLETRVMVTARKFNDLGLTNDSIKKLETIDVPARQLTAIELLVEPKDQNS